MAYFRCNMHIHISDVQPRHLNIQLFKYYCSNFVIHFLNRTNAIDVTGMWLYVWLALIVMERIKAFCYA